MNAEAEALNALGVQACMQGRFHDGVMLFDRAVTARPQLADAWNNRGIALNQLGRAAEALASYDRALACDPRHTGALINRGLILAEMGRLEDALASHEAALRIRPDLAASRGRAAALQGLKRYPECMAIYDAILASSPDDIEALNNRGAARIALRQYAQALQDFTRLAALAPNLPQAWNNRGLALSGSGRAAESLADFDKAIALWPDYADAWLNLGNALYDVSRLEEAGRCYDAVLARDPGNVHARNGRANVALRLCDWPRVAALGAKIEKAIRDGAAAGPPLLTLAYFDDPALQLQSARLFVDSLPPAAPSARKPVKARGKIRLAYLSSDFFGHATAWLATELFERHDRARFDIVGVSFGPDDGGAERARLMQAFDAFHDVGGCDAQAIASLLRREEIDIAVDLKGFTLNSRPEIFAHRAAPIQVSWLGYPGSMGADFIDYIIGDPVVTPFSDQAFYSERIVQLPHCYQVNSSRAPGPTPTRRQMGLPEHGFIFCCFNNGWKITQPVFDAWMRLVGGTPGSVLWLFEPQEDIRQRLRAAATARGVDAERLVFAAKTNHADHLARYGVADLVLDTMPCNSHTTASDALWAGAPLLTCRGRSFAARVAASILQAIGLPELITEDLQAYEALALRLAQNAAALNTLKQRIAANRAATPLFDVARFCADIETAYARMHERAVQGQAPCGFRV